MKNKNEETNKTEAKKKKKPCFIMISRHQHNSERISNHSVEEDECIDGP